MGEIIFGIAKALIIAGVAAGISYAIQTPTDGVIEPILFPREVP